MANQNIVGTIPITWDSLGELTWDCAWGDETYVQWLRDTYGIVSPRTDAAKIQWDKAQYVVVDLEIPVNLPWDDSSIDWNERFPTHPQFGLLYVTWNSITRAQMSQVLCPFVKTQGGVVFETWNPRELEELSHDPSKLKNKKKTYQEVEEQSSADRWREILENIRKAEEGELEIDIQKDIEIIEAPQTKTISLIFMMDGVDSTTLVNEIKDKAQVEVSNMIHEQLGSQPKVKVKKVRIL